MPAKKQTRRQKKSQKTQKSARRRKNRTHSRRLKGGNYARNITVNTVEGTPVEENAVLSVPGRGTMSVKAYQRLTEDLDRNGDDIYR